MEFYVAEIFKVIKNVVAAEIPGITFLFNKVPGGVKSYPICLVTVNTELKSVKYGCVIYNYTWTITIQENPNVDTKEDKPLGLREFEVIESVANTLQNQELWDVEAPGVTNPLISQVITGDNYGEPREFFQASIILKHMLRGSR